MKIAVTGASGHIGNNLCRMLIEQGHQVKALVYRGMKGLEDLPLEWLRGDVTSEADLVRLCAGREVVFHLAAHLSLLKNDPLCQKINIDSLQNLIRAARMEGVRKIIHFSSIHAFLPDHTAELNEFCELAFESRIPYDQSKARGQKIMLDASSDELEITILNPTAVIGPNDFKPSVLGSALIRFYQGRNPALIHGGYNWVDVRDVCKAAMNAIKKGKAGTCYLLGGEWQNLHTIGNEIEKLGGCKTPTLELPVWMARLAQPLLNMHSALTGKPLLYTAVTLHTLKNSHRNISSDKARLTLDFNPRPLSETIHDTISWFRDNKYI